MSKIILTGGAGFIGSALLSTLNQSGHSDIIVVDNLSTSTKWQNLVGKKFSDYIHKDKFIELVDDGKFKGEISAIFHLGACSATTEKDVDYLFRNNVNYSKSLAKLAISQNARFVYASSAATYGDGTNGYDDDLSRIPNLKPLNGYGYSKQLFDLWIINNSLLDKVVGLKFFNVYGPNEDHKNEMRSVVHKAWKQVKENGIVKLFRSNDPKFKDGEQCRDFVYVKDCANVMNSLLSDQYSHVHGIFNLGSGIARSWNDLATSVFKALGLSPKIEYIDMPGSLKGQYQNYTKAEMHRLINTGIASKFHSLEEGVRDYVVNHLEQGEKRL